MAPSSGNFEILQLWAYNSHEESSSLLRSLSTDLGTGPTAKFEAGETRSHPGMWSVDGVRVTPRAEVHESSVDSL